jgi:hypothetical protein
VRGLGEDLRPGPVECNRRRPEGIADLPGGGAGMPAVAVGVVAATDAELVTR